MSNNLAIGIDDLFQANAEEQKAVTEEESGAESLELDEEGTTDDEAETSESENEETQEDVFYEIDGEEIPVDQILEWKNGHLRLSDYTKKTQELATQKKSLAADYAQKLDAYVKTFEEIVLEDQKSIDWDELREIDPSEYLKQKEIQEKRLSALKKAKAESGGLNESNRKEKQAEETQKLFEAMPGWTDAKGVVNAKIVNDEFALMGQYAASLGYTAEEMQNMLDHRQYVALLKAAKFDALKTKAPNKIKKVVKAQKVQKQTQKPASTPKRAADYFYS